MLYDKSMWYERILLVLHQRVFGMPMGPRTIQFIQQLQWSILGGAIASALLFFVSVWAARVLGAQQYGQYSFTVSAAQLVVLFITWSFEIAVVRALAFTKGDEVSQKYIVSSALAFLVVSLVFINLLLFLAPISFIRGIVMVFASVLAIKLMFDGMMRGLGLFGYQAIGKIIEATTVLIAFAVLVRTGSLMSYKDYLLALIIGSLALLVWYLFKIRNDVSFQSISHSAFQVLWTYGSRAMIWVALSTITGFAAKYIIKAIVGYQFLGQFSAYQLTTIAALAFFGGLVANVFFPVAVQEGDSNAMWHKMHRTALVGWLPLWVSGSLVANIGVVLYGHSYYLTWWFGVGMAGIAVAQFLCGMYLWIIASDGVRGVKYIAFHSAMSGLIFIVLLASVLRMNALYGILGSYVVASIYAVWAIYRWRVVLKR